MKTLCIISFIVLVSCNLFKPFADESNFSIAEDKYKDGEFIQALALVDQDLSNDPLNSDLLYLRTKIRLKIFYEIDGETGPLNILNLVDQFAELDSLNTNSVPFYNTLVHPITKVRINDLIEHKRVDLISKTREIEMFTVILADLQKIYRQETHGTFGKEFIEADYAILLAMTGLVEMRDTNIDGQVDSSDYFFELEVTTDAANLPLVADSVIFDTNLAETDTAVLRPLLIFMKDNGITLDNDNSFQPETNSQHALFFQDHLLAFVTSEIARFMGDIETIRSVFQNTISADIGNEGKLFLAIQILQDIRNNSDDEDFETLVNGMEDIDAELDRFKRTAIEKEIWDKFLKPEIRIIPGVVDIFNLL